MKHDERIVLKVEEMKRYVRELGQILPDKKTYLADLVLRRGCEKTVQLAIECVIDILAIIVSKESLGPPKDEDSYLELTRNVQILSEDMYLKVQKMKGFRNILVHRYADLDDTKAYESITEGINDFVDFQKEIAQYLTS